MNILFSSERYMKASGWACVEFRMEDVSAARKSREVCSSDTLRAGDVGFRVEGVPDMRKTRGSRWFGYASGRGSWLSGRGRADSRKGGRTRFERGGNDGSWGLVPDGAWWGGEWGGADLFLADGSICLLPPFRSRSRPRRSGSLVFRSLCPVVGVPANPAAPSPFRSRSRP